jgi:hypothetical protein
MAWVITSNLQQAERCPLRTKIRSELDEGLRETRHVSAAQTDDSTVKRHFELDP